MPTIIRFLLCVGVLYVAFLLCGWAVLGPYNPKVTLCVDSTFFSFPDVYRFLVS